MSSRIPLDLSGGFRIQPRASVAGLFPAPCLRGKECCDAGLFWRFLAFVAIPGVLIVAVGETLFEIPELPLDLRLAAILTLLSSSALRGATPNKTAALQMHLEAAAAAPEVMAEPLREALAGVLAGWLQVQCHPASVAFDHCPASSPGPCLH